MISVTTVPPPGPLAASCNTRYDNLSGLKRFLPDKLFKMSILSGQRPVLPDVFLVQC